jgi:hypothetical protein
MMALMKETFLKVQVNLLGENTGIDEQQHSKSKPVKTFCYEYATIETQLA